MMLHDVIISAASEHGAQTVAISTDKVSLLVSRICERADYRVEPVVRNLILYDGIAIGVCGPAAAAAMADDPRWSGYSTSADRNASFLATAKILSLLLPAIGQLIVDDGLWTSRPDSRRLARGELDTTSRLKSRTFAPGEQSNIICEKLYIVERAWGCIGLASLDPILLHLYQGDISVAPLVTMMLLPACDGEAWLFWLKGAVLDHNVHSL